jgi:integrase
VGEVALLEVTSFDLRRGALTFSRPKVDKVQTHTLTGDTLRALLAWQESGDCPTLGPLLRASRRGGALTHGGISERALTGRVRQLGRRLGIASLSAHDCRHYWATRATAMGTHPKALQQAGGWNSPAMVMRYVDEAEIANAGVKL